ncbi:MAG: hypothetical protein R3B13_17310 [Polyangiaceae bacterium]
MKRFAWGAALAAIVGASMGGCSSGGSSGGGGSPVYQCSNGNTVRVLQPCAGCASANCNAESGACFGPQWASAQFSGVCMPLINCMCGCADQVCVDQCVLSAPGDCRTCLSAMGNCLSSRCSSDCPGFPFGALPGGGSGGNGVGGLANLGGFGAGGSGGGLGGLAGFGGGLGGFAGGFGGFAGGFGGLGGGTGCLPPEFPCFDGNECCSGQCVNMYCQ